MAYTVMFGTDPELFVRNTLTGQFVSAHDLVPGTKENPHHLGDGFSIHADGTAVEVGIRPAASVRDVIRNIRAVVQLARKFLPKDHEFVAAPYVLYEPTVWNNIPSKAKELGCDPDFNAFTGLQNVIKVPDKYPTLRTGAGHVHISWLNPGEYVDPLNEDHFNDCRLIIQALENNIDILHRALPTLAPRAECLRTMLYGSPGAFRPKPYGVEWRSPDNRWIANHSVATQFMYYVLACVTTVIDDIKDAQGYIKGSGPLYNPASSSRFTY